MLTFMFEADSWIGCRGGWVVLPAGSAWELLRDDGDTVHVDIPELGGSTIVDASAGSIRDGIPAPRELHWAEAEEMDRRFPAWGPFAASEKWAPERLPTPEERRAHRRRVDLAKAVLRDYYAWQNAIPLSVEAMKLAEQVARNLAGWMAAEVHVAPRPAGKRPGPAERSRDWDDADVASVRSRAPRRASPLDDSGAADAAERREAGDAAILQRDLNWGVQADVPRAVVWVARDLCFAGHDDLVAVLKRFAEMVDARERERRTHIAACVSNLRGPEDTPPRDPRVGRPEVDRWHEATAFVEDALAQDRVYRQVMELAARYPGSPQTDFARQLGLEPAKLGQLAHQLRTAGHLRWMKRKGRVLLWPANAELPAGAAGWGEAFPGQ